VRSRSRRVFGGGHRCCANKNKNESEADGGDDERYESRADAIARFERAESSAAGGKEAFYSRLGGGIAATLSGVYPEDARMLVLCGRGRNGEIGMRTASALSARGHEVCCYYGGGRLPEPIVRAGVTHVDFVPSTAEYYWDVCVDAVMGIGYDGGDIRDSAFVPFAFVTQTSLPVVSIDVPSAWDVDSGPREVDVRTDDFVKPRLLISLGRPKKCAQHFGGALHYVLDYDGIGNSSKNQGKQKEAELFASNARSFIGNNGEDYGRAGMFQATLFTKRESKRSWVYPDSEDAADDVWDEME